MNETIVWRPMDLAGADELMTWRYDAPYDRYNLAVDARCRSEMAAFLVAPHNAYYRLDDGQGHVVAFCCFGADARVPGGDYGEDAVDIGLGLRPDLTGHRLGEGIIRTALHLAIALYKPQHLRVTIADFNLRAQKAWRKVGFAPLCSFRSSHTGQLFRILTRPTAS